MAQLSSKSAVGKLRNSLNGRRWADVTSDEELSISLAVHNSKVLSESKSRGLMLSHFKIRIPDLESSRSRIGSFFRLGGTKNGADKKNVLNSKPIDSNIQSTNTKRTAAGAAHRTDFTGISEDIQRQEALSSAAKTAPLTNRACSNTPSRRPSVIACNATSSIGPTSTLHGSIATGIVPATTPRLPAPSATPPQEASFQTTATRKNTKRLVPQLISSSVSSSHRQPSLMKPTVLAAALSMSSVTVCANNKKDEEKTGAVIDIASAQKPGRVNANRSSKGTGEEVLRAAISLKKLATRFLPSPSAELSSSSSTSQSYCSNDGCSSHNVHPSGVALPPTKLVQENQRDETALRALSPRPVKCLAHRGDPARQQSITNPKTSVPAGDNYSSPLHTNVTSGRRSPTACRDVDNVVLLNGSREVAAVINLPICFGTEDSPSDSCRGVFYGGMVEIPNIDVVNSSHIPQNRSDLFALRPAQSPSEFMTSNNVHSQSGTYASWSSRDMRPDLMMWHVHPPEHMKYSDGYCHNKPSLHPSASSYNCPYIQLHDPQHSQDGYSYKWPRLSLPQTYYGLTNHQQVNHMAATGPDCMNIYFPYCLPNAASCYQEGLRSDYARPPLVRSVTVAQQANTGTGTKPVYHSKYVQGRKDEFTINRPRPSHARASAVRWGRSNARDHPETFRYPGGAKIYDNVRVVANAVKRIDDTKDPLCTTVIAPINQQRVATSEGAVGKKVERGVQQQGQNREAGEFPSLQQARIQRSVPKSSVRIRANRATPFIAANDVIKARSGLPNLCPSIIENAAIKTNESGKFPQAAVLPVTYRRDSLIITSGASCSKVKDPPPPPPPPPPVAPLLKPKPTNNQIKAPTIKTKRPLNMRLNKKSGKRKPVTSGNSHQCDSSRMRQIVIVQSSRAYQQYIKLKPRDLRDASDPQTPSPRAQESTHRIFMDSLNAWKRKLQTVMQSNELSIDSQAGYLANETNTDQENQGTGNSVLLSMTDTQKKPKQLSESTSSTTLLVQFAREIGEGFSCHQKPPSAGVSESR